MSKVSRLEKIIKLKHSLFWLFKLLRIELISLFKLKQNTKVSSEVLVLCKHLPPNDSGGVFRPLSWAKYASNKDICIQFISNRPINISNPSKSGLYLSNQWPSDIKINYTEESILFPAYRLIPHIDGSFKDAIDAIDKALDIYVRSKPKSIVVTGPSFDYFISGYYLSKIFDIPLILDYRDEWSLNPFKFVEATADNEKWERKVLSRASEIIYTTSSMAQFNCDYFHPRGKVHVINNGWDPSDHCTTGEIKKTSSGTISLLFTGVLAEHTPPFRFLTDLNTVVKKYHLDVEVTFIGRITDDIRKALESLETNFNIELLESIPRDQCFTKMQEADALLLFSPSKMERYIPGKLFDYAASRTPIIAHGVDGEIKSALSEGSLGIFIEDGDIEQLFKILSGIKETSNFQPSQDWLNSKSREQLAEQFFNVVKNAQ